jgi:hypothetical protein
VLGDVARQHRRCRKPASGDRCCSRGSPSAASASSPTAA